MTWETGNTPLAPDREGGPEVNLDCEGDGTERYGSREGERWASMCYHHGLSYMIVCDSVVIDPRLSHGG